MVAAGLAWDLQSATAGRFVLGLGSQVKGHNQRRFSVPWSPPAPRLREYVEAIQAIWDCWRDGTPLQYEGKHYPVQSDDAQFHARATDQCVTQITHSSRWARYDERCGKRL